MINTGQTNIFLAASLRSGSTHISRNLCKLLDFRMGRVNGLHGEGVEEQNINLVSASILMPYGRFVFQQHTKGTPMNLEAIKGFNNKLVVLTRNIFDSLLSLREWTTSPDVGIIPGIVFPSDWKQWREHAQYDWLVRNVTPWYLAFCYSWLSVPSVVCWLDYDTYYSDQAKGMSQLLASLGAPPVDENLMRAVVNDTSSMRTGISGRGVKTIPKNFQRDVKAQIDAWGPWAKPIRKKLL